MPMHSGRMEANMIINKLRLELKDNKAVVSCDFTVKNEVKTLWYSFDKEYEKYIVTESLDAFVVGLLLIAMKNQEDIDIQGKISARLYYQIRHYVIPALSLANGEWRKIDIHAAELCDANYSTAPIAGTGISCGVDSFSTIYDHLNENKYHSIDYFTFFNVGSHGDFDSIKASEVFIKRMKLVKPYVNSTGKKLITIDTNLSDLLMMSHLQTHTIRAVSCILNLQKLFRYYYYASALRFDYFEINDKYMAYYETLLLSMLSTESTTFYSAVSQYTRSERTDLITNYGPSYEYLNVCVSPQNSIDGSNCSVCSKCMRTQLTLDVLGKLDYYDKVFDLEKYCQRKVKYIGQILAFRSQNLYFEDIYKLMLKKITKYPLNRRLCLYC